MLRAVLAARLLGQDGVAGVGLEQDLDDGVLGRAIDFRDVVVGPLGADLQHLEVERGAVDDGACRACRLDGDIEHGVERLRHGAACGWGGAFDEVKSAAATMPAENPDFTGTVTIQEGLDYT